VNDLEDHITVYDIKCIVDAEVVKVACTKDLPCAVKVVKAKFHYAIQLANQLASWFASWSATC